MTRIAARETWGVFGVPIYGAFFANLAVFPKLQKYPNPPGKRKHPQAIICGLWVFYDGDYKKSGQPYPSPPASRRTSSRARGDSSSPAASRLTSAAVSLGVERSEDLCFYALCVVRSPVAESTVNLG